MARYQFLNQTPNESFSMLLSIAYEKCRLLQAGQELDDMTHMEHIQFYTLELSGRAGSSQNSMT